MKAFGAFLVFHNSHRERARANKMDRQTLRKKATSKLFAFIMICGLFLNGCIGSSQKRNPNLQRRDSKTRTVVVKSSLRNSQNIIKREPEYIAKVLRRQPKNSWISHDRDVYDHLGQDEAEKVFKIYPWLKVPQKKRKAGDSD